MATNCHLFPLYHVEPGIYGALLYLDITQTQNFHLRNIHHYLRLAGNIMQLKRLRNKEINETFRTHLNDCSNARFTVSQFW